MCPDPYAAKSLSTKYPCADKNIVNGKVCVILDARAGNRGLELVQYPSRAVLKNEIHEIILTAEPEAGPGKVVNDISYLGYFEVLESGVIWVDDKVMVGGREIGTLAGYDMTHFPNHMNIIIKITGSLYTGLEAGFKVGDPISFIFPGRPKN
ncbi:MAG TPA: hypothetical protein VN376_03670 [Longilinea sp.]|nr:hypothetical protein [Longilinea sp.]